MNFKKAKKTQEGSKRLKKANVLRSLNKAQKNSRWFKKAQEVFK